MTFKEVIDAMIKSNASDIFVRVAGPLRARIRTEIKTINPDYKFSPEDIDKIISEITDPHKRERLEKEKSCEFTSYFGERWRLRIGIFYQRNSLSIVIRRIDLKVPSFKDLNLPKKVLEKFCQERRGLILMAGVTGSGKSTAIASMIEFINQNYGRHILTIEEPVEFIFEDNKSIINQREIGADVFSYSAALKQFAVHSPDVLFVGNIRDQATCHAALTAAETGTLVFSTVHTINATSAIERIVNFFPPQQHHFIFNQLSFLLKGVVSLRLIPRIDIEGLIPAYEVMTLSPTVSSLIREKKIWDIPKYISTGEIYGMENFNQCLMRLILEGKISPEVAVEYSDRKEELMLQLRHKDLME